MATTSKSPGTLASSYHVNAYVQSMVCRVVDVRLALEHAMWLFLRLWFCLFYKVPQVLFACVFVFPLRFVCVLSSLYHILLYVFCSYVCCSFCLIVIVNMYFVLTFIVLGALL